MNPLLEMQKELENRSLSSRGLVQSIVDLVRSTDGEGERVFTQFYENEALARAVECDVQRERHDGREPLHGIPVSVKDLFDIEGKVTTAGSAVLRGRKPAEQNAAIVNKLLQAGAIIVGKTNMTEFAYSALGINPHYGTPANPYDRESRRIPGGSSSGAAVSVSDGMAAVALATDTGGSIRIPAALCGLVGFKPTARTVPASGCFPLSVSFDSIGPIGKTVACCAAAFSAIRTSANSVRSPIDSSTIKLGVPDCYLLEDQDEHVSRSFESALSRLSEGGILIETMPFKFIEKIPQLSSEGGMVAIEAYQFHEELLRNSASEYDPRVSKRLLEGQSRNMRDYFEVMNHRKSLIDEFEASLSLYDAFIMPTVPVIAPKIRSLEDEDAYFRANGLMLRNPSVVNFLDGCAVTLPCHEHGTAPAGVSLFSASHKDNELLGLARRAEELLAGAN